MKSDDSKPMKRSQNTRKDTSTGNVEDLIRQIGDEAMRRTIERAKREPRSSTNSTPQPTAPASSHTSETPTGDMEEQPEHIQELARRLFAAAISCWTPGMSLRQAYDEFVKNQEGKVGSYWIDLAKQVTAHHWDQQV